VGPGFDIKPYVVYTDLKVDPSNGLVIFQVLFFPSYPPHPVLFSHPTFLGNSADSPIWLSLFSVFDLLRGQHLYTYGWIMLHTHTYKCEITHLSVTRPIHMWHDSCICDMTYLCVTWLIYVWSDSAYRWWPRIAWSIYFPAISRICVGVCVCVYVCMWHD